MLDNPYHSPAAGLNEGAAFPFGDYPPPTWPNRWKLLVVALILVGFHAAALTVIGVDAQRQRAEQHARWKEEGHTPTVYDLKLLGGRVTTLGHYACAVFLVIGGGQALLVLAWSILASLLPKLRPWRWPHLGLTLLLRWSPPLGVFAASALFLLAHLALLAMLLSEPRYFELPVWLAACGAIMHLGVAALQVRAITAA